MIESLLFLLLFAAVLDTRHFSGGTIRWKPVDPYDTSNSSSIIITQTYYWTYPVVQCSLNVPASTSAYRSMASINLMCVVDCSTDGGYSTKPVSILTDCISSSSSLGILTSQRSVNITLAAGAHFYIANVGSSWLPLGYPTQTGLEWSIVTYIDLRKRPDGFLNTPPEASIISPQYVIVNRTTQMRIVVSDANVGDDIRCRWSTYTSGYRRRRRTNENLFEGERIRQLRKRYAANNCTNDKSKCDTVCNKGCQCTCPTCTTANCSGSLCKAQYTCSQITTTSTTDIPGTPQSTSSYPIRQAINECGGICFPDSVANDTTLSNCTISFTGLVAGTWYAIAVQAEDFIDSTSTTPMSSVPVQFLVYVLPEPQCSNVPVILPYEGCLEVTAGVLTNFTLYVLDRCNSSSITISDMIVSSDSTGIQSGNLTESFANSSLYYKTFMFTPPMNQTGFQQICTTAYTTEFAESDEYCVMFTVTESSDLCPTTTTTSTTTTTTSTSSTTSTASTSSTSTTSSSTSTTTTMSTSSTSTTSSSSSTTAKTSTSSTITTSTTTTTSTSSTTTTTVTIELQTSSTTSGKGPSWGLIAGICSAALPLGLCCCCCLYRLLWSHGGKRRRHTEEEEENVLRYRYFTESTNSVSRTSTTQTNPNTLIEVPKKSYQVYDIGSRDSSINTTSTNMEGEESILVRMYRNTNGRHANSMQSNNTNESIEMASVLMRRQRDHIIAGSRTITPTTAYANSLGTITRTSQQIAERFHGNYSMKDTFNASIFRSASLDNDHLDAATKN